MELALIGTLLGVFGAGFSVFTYFDKERLNLARQIAVLENRVGNNENHIKNIEERIEKQLDSIHDDLRMIFDKLGGTR